MTKREAIKALLEKLGGEEADIPAFATTAEAIAFLTECLSVDNGAVAFALPED